MRIATYRAKSLTAAPNSDACRWAFTLLEVVVVLALLSILALAAAWSLKQPLQNARLKHAISRIEDCDRQARDLARKRACPVELRFQSQGVVRRANLRPARLEATAYSIRWDGGMRIDRFLVGGKSLRGDGLQILVSQTGQSETYALRIRAGAERYAWLLVMGNTGQCVRFDEDEEVERIVSLQR